MRCVTKEKNDEKQDSKTARATGPYVGQNKSLTQSVICTVWLLPDKALPQQRLIILVNFYVDVFVSVRE